ncbi:2Fe-2S iron-sulfur cluster-binding protein [Granulicoccus sp. GXG6511]|uniref:2Fe-2S iron-sulfur cluster-binding protein n=1 Tax=Granulicoccus sp. GXG6511 TaxID=3381351 RepID=UPI003D7D4F0F
MPEIIVEPNGVKVPVAEGDTIMAALNKNGYTFLLGCRRGGCGICKVRVVEGTIEHNRPVAETALPAEERAEGVCLGCRAVPQGEEIRITLLKSALRVTNPLLHPPAA